MRNYLPLAALLLSACALNRPGMADLPSRELAGHVTISDNAYYFSPCETSSDARWWVTLVDTAVAQFRQAREEGRVTEGRSSFVRWEAAVTDERHVGPGGQALLVRRIHELRPAGTGDCGAPDAR